MKISFFIILFSLAFISSANFEWILFNQFTKNQPKENIIISPLSLFQGISLVSNGAKDNTQMELLHSIDQENIFESNEKNVQIVKSASQTAGLVIANAVMSKFSPSTDFIAKCNQFKATVSQLLSVNQVNDWCSAKTNGKISHIIDSISNVDLIILNAVYFKGIWLNKFNPADTKQGVFHSSKGDQNVQMMYMNIEADYYEDSSVQIIRLPYTEQTVTAMIYLPKNDIDQFIYEFKMEHYHSLLNNNKTPIQLTLPKFELSFQTSLVDAIKNLGVNDAFDPAKADFSNINQHSKLYISDILQKTYIKFDEEGTEAAAVTSIKMTRSPFPMPTIYQTMIVDRPFMLIINHSNINQGNLFISKITNIN